VLLAVIIGFAPAALASAQFVLFPVAAEPGNGPRGICSGPDGNVWFTVANRVGRMTPSGALVEFELPIANSRPGDIVTGSDGDLWFLEENARMVGRISPTGSITEYPIPAANAAPRQIVVGADTAIWFSDFIRRSIWRMDSPGSFTEYPTSAESYGLAAGSDGNLWFTTFFGLPRSIGRLTPSGAVTLFPRPSSSFGWRCGLGPDGNVWYTTARAFGRVTPSGAITEFPVMSDRGHVPTAVASGSDGNLWMPVDESFQCIPPCTPPEEKDGILRVSTTGFQTRYELTADLQILDGSTITAGPGGSMWFTALHGLVRFFPADLAGGTPSVQVPTMGDVARVALVGLLTLAGLAFLRR
jgi:virginiamycin B lyase